jgi:hypothetical protein
MLKLIDIFVWICVALLILTLIVTIAKADEPLSATTLETADTRVRGLVAATLPKATAHGSQLHAPGCLLV